MTLHENLEVKRRRNIVELSRSGACHLCQSTSGSRSCHRFICNGSDDDGKQIDGAENQAIGAPEPQSEVPMRTCMCYGNTTTWPYSLKVCETCIDDDMRSSTGRIRCCGICGVVACDENCGVELVEVTDREEWNNAGCLECRGMESFSEIELFRRRPCPGGIPRASRVCTSCLELFSLFSYGNKYQFKCRYFKCNNLLVNSAIVEMKRSMTPFPLACLPVELLDSIIDFLGGQDLFNCGLICTSMFKKVENMAKGIVTRWNHTLPTGPIKMFRCDNSSNRKNLVYAEGKNRRSLQPPEDGKTWVGVLNQMELLTRDVFYFDFQIRAGDEGAPFRYLRNCNKLSFDCVYSRPSGTVTTITPYLDVHNGLSIRGGQALVTKYKWHRRSLLEEREEMNGTSTIIFSTDKELKCASGLHRVLFTYNCFCGAEGLGSIGILRKQGEDISWASTYALVRENRMEEHIFGMEYDADSCTITYYKKNSLTNQIEATSPSGVGRSVPVGGSLCFAAGLSHINLGVKSNQLSIRELNEDEWSKFLSHTPERNIIPRVRGHDRERFMRYLHHRDQRDVAGRNGRAGRNGDENNADRIERELEEEHMMDMLLEEEIEAMNDADSDDEDDMDVENENPQGVRIEIDLT